MGHSALERAFEGVAIWHRKFALTFTLSLVEVADEDITIRRLENAGTMRDAFVELAFEDAAIWEGHLSMALVLASNEIANIYSPVRLTVFASAVRHTL